MSIKDLEPCEVFKFLAEIAAIPHGSGNTKKISDYLVNFAKSRNIKVRQDDSNNVIMWKCATKGYEGEPAVILQGHMDMVTVKTPECDKDMDTEGLELVVDGDYIYAKDTSLGADDGIAIAYILALFDSDVIEHPPLEAIITVDEEIGMLGATALDLSDIAGRTMLNIDSEEEGIFTAGCAGGATVGLSFDITRRTVAGQIMDITIDGLTGGHSGTEINCQRANAIELLGRFLNRIFVYADYDLVSVYGGEKDNAIAQFAGCRIVTDEADKIKYFIEKAKHVYRAEYATTDKGLNVHGVMRGKGKASAYSRELRDRLVHALVSLPYGIMRYSYNIEGLVQTSVNKGILTENENDIMLTMSVRSSVATEKVELIDKIKAVGSLAGANVSVSGEYPAWEYVAHSHLRNTCISVYEEMFGKKPVVNTIHAGVECGIIAEKLMGLDCVSFGPDILDIHTTNEKLSISSTRRTWAFLQEVLRTL